MTEKTKHIILCLFIDEFYLNKGYKFIMYKFLNNPIFNIFIVAFIAISANFYFGSIGVFPIDTFAFFDSAFAINNGSMPFRDYWVMNGPMVDFLQSIFFMLFGVSWKSYLLHSSLVNVLFALTSYFFLKDQGLSSFMSLFYSSCIALLTYSSVGSPFPDHHSTIFSLMGIYLLIFAIKSENKKFWFLIPILFFIAFFSKQVPAIYFIILTCIVIIFYIIVRKKYNCITTLVYSSLILILLLFLFLKFNNINFNEFFVQYFLFPKTIGTERFGTFNWTFNGTISQFKFIYLALLPIVYFIVHQTKKTKKFIKSDDFISLILILMSALILIYHQLLTKNQNYIFFCLPLIFGCTHSYFKKYGFNKKIIYLILIFATVTLTAKYHIRFNIDRKFMELQNTEKSKFIDASLIDHRLKGLKWLTPESKSNNFQEVELLRSSIKYLKNYNEKYTLVTEYLFISSAIDKNVFSPNRWYTTDGVSYPLRKNNFYEHYKKFYRSKLKEKNINVVFTVMPLNISSLDFIFESNCITTSKINDILYKHEIKDCF